MGTTRFLYSIQLSLRKFWLDSTHETTWLYKNWFKSTHKSRCITEIWFKSTHDSKSFHNFDSNQLMTQKISILSRINSWLNDAIHSQFRLTFLGAFNSAVHLIWPFLGSPLKRWLRMSFFGLSAQVPFRQIYSNSSWLNQSLGVLSPFNSWFKRLSMNWLKISSWLVDAQALIQIDSWLQMLPDFSVQIKSWLNSKIFDSESTHDSTLSHTQSAGYSSYPCLLAIPIW